MIIQLYPGSNLVGTWYIHHCSCYSSFQGNIVLHIYKTIYMVDILSSCDIQFYMALYFSVNMSHKLTINVQ